MVYKLQERYLFNMAAYNHTYMVLKYQHLQTGGKTVRRNLRL